MDIVTPIITPVVESLLVPVKRHLDFLVSSSNKVEDMHVKMAELDGAARDIHTKQVSSKVNRRVIPHRVPDWLAEVQTIKAEMADKIPTRGVGCFNLKTRYKTGKYSSDILKRIDRLMKEKAEIVWANEIIPLGVVSPPRFPVVHQDICQNKNRIESRYLIFNDALKSLEPNNIKTQKMALCGMAGVGKTTMMEDLEKVAIDRKMFDIIVKMAVGQNSNPEVAQQTVAEYTGEALTETIKDTRAEHLKKKFQRISEDGKKKILIILDDVWEEFNLKDIGLASPLPSGFKLLLTSRDENVCIHMGVETSSIFRINVLEEREAKNLFWDTARLVSDGDFEPDLQRIGEDIVKRCGGLPIAIKTIASALKDNKKKYAWNDVLNRLQKKRFHGFNTKAVFEISYKNLKDDDLKAIFILSGLFPENYHIGKEDLLRYGWGLNFYKEGHTIATARDRVHTCVDTLIGLNLLIKSDREGCVKMHDLVRDFVLSNISIVKQASIVNHENNISEQLKEEESYERILLKCKGMLEFPVDFYHPNVSLLKLMDGDELLKFPEDFYTRMKKLEVVAYENMHRPFLPQYSANLRALFLHSCTLVDDDMPFLGDLTNLEILSIAHCGITKLPYKIGMLKKLKLLDLTGCANLCIDDGDFQSLDKLEELYMRVYKGGPIWLTNANSKELKMRKLFALELEFFGNGPQPINVSFKNLNGYLWGVH